MAKGKREDLRKDKAILKKILSISEEMHNITDIDILLEKILREIRKFTNAEGGTLFLVEDGKLKISYTQNEVLFGSDPSQKYQYLYHAVPIDRSSIAGSAAMAGKMIAYDDVYKLPKDCGCGFNPDFDLKNNYRTKSVLAVPLKTIRNKVIGVMQVINAKNQRKKVVPFSEKDKIFVSYFGNDAAIAIEKAITTREMILRMLKMVEYRDPKETGSHVKRMGAYAVEIYGKWAEARGLPQELIRRFKDKFSIAAMLHDAGKIGISDKILKKPGKLDDEEYQAMKMHTVFGYRLFANTNSELDAMAAEVALNHHERWDGTGYPGKMTGLYTCEELNPECRGKEGTQIPVTGRIVAIADVFDALISRRIYKPAWEEARVLDYMRENSGRHFDPEVIDAFFSIYDVIRAIRERYMEEEEAAPAL